MDKQLERAITRVVGHGMPVSADELRSIESLRVKHARDLGGIEDCTSVRVLMLTGCDPVSLESLVGLEQLKTVLVECSGLTSLQGVQNLPESLLMVKAGYNLVEDLTPLLERPLLASLEVHANPLNEESYLRVLPELRDRGVDVLASDEREWRLTLRLQELGLPFCYYQGPGGYHLCRPGLRFTNRPEADHPVVAPEMLESLLDAGDPAEIHALFERDDLLWPPA